MHWPVRAERLRALVPGELELEAFEGAHWLGMTSFLLTDMHPRWLPPIPFVSTFPELNVRTYVTLGGKPGIYFFSLDAGSLLAVLGARATYSLPYFHARASIREEGGWILYRSERVGGNAAFEARYRANGEGAQPTPGSLEHFLTERYALYVVRDGRTRRGDIQHAPWRLRPAEAQIARNTMAGAAGIELPPQEPLLHYSERQDTTFWPLADVGTV
jgi:uncharacterized protein YqjF (DUF2071 family)